MWLLKELWADRRRHLVDGAAAATALFLVLMVNILSSGILDSLARQFSALGLSAAMVAAEPKAGWPGWFEAFCRDNGLTDGVTVKTVPYGEAQRLYCSSALTRLFELTLAQGRFYDARDELGQDAVCVLGWQEWDRRGRPALGGTIDLEGAEFTVIGVLADQQQCLFLDLSHAILFPERWGIGRPGTVDGFFRDGGQAVEEQLDVLLGKDRYTLVRQQDLKQALGQGRKLVQNILLFLAMAAMAVALAGLINNTLAGIRQRRYEIGLKKALGASRADIILQFLVENAVVLLAAAATALIAALGLCALGRLAGITGLKVEWGANLALTARILAAGTAVGLIPAWQAGRMTIAEALRRDDN
jgi:hypothetical protein